MDSLAAEDALGVVDLLLPGERDMLRQPLIDFVDNLKRLEIADSTASLDKVGGLDIAFQDVNVDETDTNVDDVADIRITATSTASIDGETRADRPVADRRGVRRQSARHGQRTAGLRRRLEAGDGEA